MSATKNTHPFLPVATLDDVLDYQPQDPTTHTPSPLVNAVAEALYKTKYHDAGQVADYLELDRRKLTAALQIELGLSLQELIIEYRLHRIQQYIEQHPDATLDKVAASNGYSSDSAIWRLFFRRLGTTPSGETSTGNKEEWRKKMNRLNAKKR